MKAEWNGESFDYIMGSGEVYRLTIDVSPEVLFGTKWYWVPNEEVNKFKSELKNELGGELHLGDNSMRLSFSRNVKIPEIEAWVSQKFPGVTFQYGSFRSHSGNWGYSGTDPIKSAS